MEIVTRPTSLPRIKWWAEVGLGARLLEGYGLKWKKLLGMMIPPRHEKTQLIVFNKRL
jgi:hypothetical protein